MRDFRTEMAGNCVIAKDQLSGAVWSRWDKIRDRGSSESRISQLTEYVEVGLPWKSRCESW